MVVAFRRHTLLPAPPLALIGESNPSFTMHWLGSIGDGSFVIRKIPRAHA